MPRAFFVVHLLRKPEENRHAARQLPHLPVLLQARYIRALIGFGLKLRRVDVLIKVADETSSLFYTIQSA